MPPVRSRQKLSYRVNKNSDANCIAGTRLFVTERDEWKSGKHPICYAPPPDPRAVARSDDKLRRGIQ